MATGQKKTRLLLGKLNRQLAKVVSKPTPENIHRFRTSARRLEVALTELVSKPGHKGRKLFKILSRLRKKAGRVRDLDVQMKLLRGLKMPEGARHKSQMLQALGEERIQREKKVAEAFNKHTVRELRRRLKGAAAMDIREVEAWQRAQNRLSELEHQLDASEKVLHRYRILGKRVRYLIELAEDTSETEQRIGQLKKMQDALGEWHDWLKLTQRTESFLREAPGSPLVAALRNLTRAKFRHAVTAIGEVQIAWGIKKPASAEEIIHRKESTSSASVPRTAA